MAKRKKLGMKIGTKAKVLGVLGLFVAVPLLLFPTVSNHFAPKKIEESFVEMSATAISSPEPAQFFLRANSDPSHERPLFPLSVIPRGVASAQELKTVLAHDPVATAHYAGFSVADSRVIKVDKARAVFVSYRFGNRIYWTRNRMWLKRGETLLSDGWSSARTRCGNRISDDAMLPVMAHDPPKKMLEEPAPLPDLQFAENPTDFSPLLLAENHEPLPPGSSFIPPPGSGFPGPPIGCCGSIRPPGPPVKPPPVTTPEPETWVLLIFGITFVCLIRKKLITLPRILCGSIIHKVFPRIPFKSLIQHNLPR